MRVLTRPCESPPIPGPRQSPAPCWGRLSLVAGREGSRQCGPVVTLSSHGCPKEVLLRAPGTEGAKSRGTPIPGRPPQVAAAGTWGLRDSCPALCPTSGLLARAHTGGCDPRPRTALVATAAAARVAARVAALCFQPLTRVWQGRAGCTAHTVHPPSRCVWGPSGETSTRGSWPGTGPQAPQRWRDP